MNLFRAVLTCTVAVAARAAAEAPPTADPLPLTLPPAVPEITFSFLRVFGALVVVLALFFAGAWLFRQWQRGLPHRGQPARLRILEIRTLGARQALYVVGYDRRRLLLAASPGGITLLDRLPEAEAAETSLPEPPASFRDVLRQLLPAR